MDGQVLGPPGGRLKTQGAQGGRAQGPRRARPARPTPGSCNPFGLTARRGSFAPCMWRGPRGCRACSTPTRFGWCGGSWLAIMIFVLTVLALVFLVWVVFVGWTNGSVGDKEIRPTTGCESTPTPDRNPTPIEPTGPDDAKAGHDPAGSPLASFFGVISAVVFCWATMVLGKK